MKAIVIFVTCANKREARSIATSLLKKRLAACVNIVDKVKSFFWWKAKVESSQETLLVIKSRKDRLARIIRVVRSLHSYQVPEIITLPIIDGYPAYLKWIDDCVLGSG